MIAFIRNQLEHNYDQLTPHQVQQHQHALVHGRLIRRDVQEPHQAEDPMLIDEPVQGAANVPADEVLHVEEVAPADEFVLGQEPMLGDEPAPNVMMLVDEPRHAAEPQAAVEQMLIDEVAPDDDVVALAEVPAAVVKPAVFFRAHVTTQ